MQVAEIKHVLFWHTAGNRRLRAVRVFPGAVLIVDGHRPWPADLLATIAKEGYATVFIDDVRLVPFFVLSGGVQAVLVDARELQMLGVLALRKCREHAPATSVIVMASEASSPTVKRALESGATAFLSWPAPPHLVSQVLRSGEPS